MDAKEKDMTTENEKGLATIKFSQSSKNICGRTLFFTTKTPCPSSMDQDFG